MSAEVLRQAVSRGRLLGVAAVFVLAAVTGWSEAPSGADPNAIPAAVPGATVADQVAGLRAEIATLQAEADDLSAKMKAAQDKQMEVQKTIRAHTQGDAVSRLGMKPEDMDAETAALYDKMQKLMAELTELQAQFRKRLADNPAYQQNQKTFRDLLSEQRRMNEESNLLLTRRGTILQRIATLKRRLDELQKGDGNPPVGQGASSKP